MKKVFVVGLSKTGTSSLHAALEQVGYRSIHDPEGMLSLSEHGLTYATKMAADYDALSDLPIAGFYRELDSAFPNSLFILTTRDEDAWLQSCANHFHSTVFRPNAAVRALVERVYGSDHFDAEGFRNAYRQHTEAVLNHFADRKTDLLVLDVAQEHKWKHVCTFLGIAEPNTAYPHENRATPIPPLVKNFLRRIASLWRRITN